MENKREKPSILERLIMSAFCEGELAIEGSGESYQLVARRNGMILRLADIARLSEDDVPTQEELMLNEISLSIQQQKRKRLLGTGLDQMAPKAAEVKPQRANLRLVQ